ncbi:hypothetical protein B0H17DRAFT_1138487 [Mycena rosella]|uniref:Uncharacterized protein n=1 Tax=Mycena rosella TaxID=1033263 RepID=A0AAD7G9J6_MYCRO|nr:hypothetical protein B0H17DRAFT_1138487 [Mycena rosella]
MAASSTSPGPSLDGTLGAGEIGVVVGMFFFGIVTLQTFNYYRRFPPDSRLLKITVRHRGSVISLIRRPYRPLDRDNLVSAVPSPPRGSHRQVPYAGSCSSVTQYVPYMRPSDQTKVYWVTVTAYGRPPNTFILDPPKSAIITLVFSIGIAAGIENLHSVHLRQLNPDSIGPPPRFLLRWETIVASTIGPAANFAIAMSLCDYLSLLRESGSQFNRLKVVQYANNCGYPDYLDCRATSVTQLILFLTRKDLVFLAFYAVQPKCEATWLNGRLRFRSAEQLEQNIGSGLIFDSAGIRERRGASAPSVHVVGIQLSPVTENTEVVSSKRPWEIHQESVLAAANIRL